MRAMQPAISIAQEANAGQIADLVNQAYRPGTAEAGWTHESGLVAGERTSAQQVLGLFHDGSTVLVMQHDARIIACVHVARAGDACWIGMLATAPQRQAGGIGKAMLAAAETFALRHHQPRALKMAVLTSRPELLSFYQRRGYALNGHVSAYPLDAGVGTPQRDDLQVLELQKTVG